MKTIVRDCNDVPVRDCNGKFLVGCDGIPPVDPCGPCKSTYSMTVTLKYYTTNDCSGAPLFDGTVTENATASEDCDTYTMVFSLNTVIQSVGKWIVVDASTSQEVGEIANDANGCPTGAFTSYGCKTDGTDSVHYTAVSLT